MRTVVVAGSAVIVALAIVFHAAFPRYETRPMQGLMVLRTDRWTGAVQLCRGSLSAEAFICGGRALSANDPAPASTP